MGVPPSGFRESVKWISVDLPLPLKHFFSLWIYKELPVMTSPFWMERAGNDS